MTEAEYALLGYVIGMIVGVGGYLFFCGQKEGNRQDYIMKIGFLKSEKAKLNEDKRGLEEKLAHLERYLDLAIEEARDNKDLMLVYSRELELERDKNREIRKELDGYRSSLKMMRRTASA